MPIQPKFKLGANKITDQTQRVPIIQAFFCLPLKLRIKDFGAQNCARSGKNIISQKFDIFLHETVRFHKGLHRQIKPLSETGFMRATGRRRDQIDIAFANGLPLFMPNHNPTGSFADSESLRLVLGKPARFKRRNQRLRV